MSQASKNAVPAVVGRMLPWMGIALLTSAALLGACKKKSESTPEPTDNADGAPPQISAKQYFIKNVYPQVSGACGTCHSGAGPGSTFLADNGEDSYNAVQSALGLIAAPSKSPLVNYTHKDKTVPGLTPQQRNTMSQWLTLEATERGLAGGLAKPPTLALAYKAFADCMRFDNWVRSGMEGLPYTQTDKEGPCLGCHSIGQGSASLPADSRAAFETNKQFPFIQKLVVGTVDANGAFDQLVPAGRFAEKSNEACPPGADCHPTYGLPPNVELAINTFVQTTLENLRGGTCDNISGLPTVDAGKEAGRDGN